MSNVQKSIQDAVLGYQSKESRGDRLEEGSHEVTIVQWQVTHSRVEWNGEEKEAHKLPAFVDPTPQLGIMFRDEHGNVEFHRFNVWGYKRWEELSDVQQKSGDFEKVTFNTSVYACKQTKAGLVRQKDTKKTNGAQNFLDQFMAAVGRTGQSIGDALPKIVEEKDHLIVELVDDSYNDKKGVKVQSFNKVKELVGDFS